jgi:hypothetical protein
MSRFIIRICDGCGVEYKHYHCNRSGVCPGCRNEYYKKRRNGSIALGRNPLYPMGVTEQRKRYRHLQAELDKCETAAERKAFYDKVLTEIQLNGIWEWCISKKEKPKTPKHEDEEGNPLPGRIPHADKQIPNTKDMPY